MSNLLDYVRWRGDLSLTENPFNEVDNLILSELAYTDMAGLVPEDGTAVPLAQMAGAYLAEGRDQSHIACDPRPLLELVRGAPRFRALGVSCYVNQIDVEKELQFSAVCFTLDDGTVYLAYRGTDDSIVGWREDFNMSFLAGTPGQLAAVDYLNRLASEGTAPLRVGGHSKGGNFAVYASAFCEEAAQARILEVYSNDGPGFKRDLVTLPGYERILGRVRRILPESSLVGILLSDRKEGEIIRSDASGIQQHNPFSWQVLGPAFERADRRSDASLFMDETLEKWLDGMDDTQRRHFVAAVFDTLDASGVSTTTELSANRFLLYSAISKAAKEMDADTQRDFLQALKSLALTGTDLLWAEVKKNLDRLGIELRQNE